MRKWNRWAAWNIWLDWLSNWQFVAVAAAITLGAVIVADCVIGLATGHANPSFNVGFDVFFAIAFTAIVAWKRWK